MEPDSIKKKKKKKKKKKQLTINFIRELQQIPYNSQSEVVQEYLKAMATISSVSDDSASTDWIVTNYSQEYSWDDYSEDYKEELNDKDLGIVRKINLK